MTDTRARDALREPDYLWVRVRELLNNLGIVGPNIPHRVDEDPGPDLPGEEGTEWCVCGRIWPCEARQLGGCIDLMVEDAQRVQLTLLTLAELEAGVEGLPERHAWGDCITRAAVLDLIRKAGTPNADDYVADDLAFDAAREDRFR